MITYKYLILIVFILSCKTRDNSQKIIDIHDELTPSNDAINTNSSNFTVEEIDTISLLPTISKIPIIKLNEINLYKNSDDSLCNDFNRLQDYQVKLLYSTQELIKYYEFFDFKSYFLGRLNTLFNFVPIIIINTDWETAIYLDYFLIDSLGKPKHLFRPSYLELQPSYSFIGRGKFINDSTYELIDIKLETIDFENSLELKDSTLITYNIDFEGNIIEERINLGKDTVSFNKIK